MRKVLCVALVGVLVGCGGSDEGGDVMEGETSEDLMEVLGMAESGQTVTLMGEEFVGQFVVPAGVSIDGRGATVRGAGPAVFRLDGGEVSTQLRDMVVENAGVGVVAENGSVTLSDVEILVSAGAGLISDSVDSLRLDNVQINGGVGRENLDRIGPNLSAEDEAVAGVIVAGTPTMALSDLKVEGVAGFGVIFYDTAGVWEGGTVAEVVGYSVLVEGGLVEMHGVSVTDGLVTTEIGADFQIAMGIVATGQASIITTELEVSGVAGPWVFQAGAVVSRSTGATEG